MITYFKINFKRLFSVFACGRTGGGGGGAKSVHVRIDGGLNVSNFERTYYMDGPMVILQHPI